MTQCGTVRAYHGMVLKLKQDVIAKGGSDEEARSLETTKLSIDGTHLNGEGEIDYDHNKKEVLGVCNDISLTKAFKTLSADSNKEHLENITATNAVIVTQTNLLIGSVSAHTVSVCYLKNENSLTVSIQLGFAYLISIIVGFVPLLEVMDNASWNNKYLTRRQKFPQQYSGPGHNDPKLPTDRRYDCYDKSPFYSDKSLLGTILWIPFLYFLMDVVHVVFKTPRNHMLYKAISLWSPRKGELVDFDWELLKAFVNYFEMFVNLGLRLVPRLDLNSLYSVDDNNANKMSVKTATATFSEKHQRYLKLLRDSWLLPQMANGDFVLPFKVNDKDVMASVLLDVIDGFVDLAEVFNKGIDSLNGEISDAFGRKRNVYIDYENLDRELGNIRSISRKVDSLGALVYATGGKSLGNNHWPAGTVAAIGIACHGIASFLIMFTRLFPGAKMCARICNADDNEVSFAYYKGRCKILNMKSFTIGVSILSCSRIQKLSALIQTHFRRRVATNGKRDRFNIVNYSRNTNSTLNDVDMYNTEDTDVTNDNDIDIISNENVESLSLKIKNRSKARKLSGSTIESLDSDLTLQANTFSRNKNITSLAYDIMIIDKIEI
jgi:hypothetical protein